ncbi:MAG TPA: hypothetical protein VF006_27085 [Longimicrobium sp.]
MNQATQIALPLIFVVLLAVAIARILHVLDQLDSSLRELNAYKEGMKSAVTHVKEEAKKLVNATNEAHRLAREEGEANPGDRPPPLPPPAPPTTPVPPRPEDLDPPPLDTREESARIPAPPRLGALHERARQIYRQWCTDGRRPVADGMEIGYLRYAGDDRTSELSLPNHVFRDDQDQGEFVRFSLPGAETGVALPNPDAYFSAKVHRILFPNLSPETFNNHAELASLPPADIQRNADGHWQKSAS